MLDFENTSLDRDAPERKTEKERQKEKGKKEGKGRIGKERDGRRLSNFPHMGEER